MRNWLRNWALKGLLGATLPEDVLSANKAGILFRNKKALSPDELAKLQAEVKFFRQTELYKLMIGTPATYAKIMMFQKATTYDELVAGKMLLYALDIQQKVMHMVETGRPE